MDEIHVLDKKVHLYQPEGGFKTSLDSVVLASAVKAQAGESVLDAGCGVGGASFCLLWRVPGIKLTGIDWHDDYIDLAQKNLKLNNATANFIKADIRTYNEEQKPAFDHVMMNPPFFEAGHHTPSPDAARAQANGHQEDDLSLGDWIKAAHRLVKSNGTMTIIYPAYGTDKIIQAIGKKFGAIEIVPFWPRAGMDAKRVVIRAIKDRQTPTRILPGIVVHNDDHSYTAEADKILRDGQGI